MLVLLIRSAAANVNAALRTILDKAPRNTLQIVLGVGDMRPAVELYSQRSRQRKTGGWGVEEEVALNRAVYKARCGLVFVNCKN